METLAEIRERPEFEEARKATSEQMPASVTFSLVRFLTDKALEWKESEEGKKEIKRLRVNKLHRQAYANKQRKEPN